MSTLPEVVIQVQDGGLGILPNTAGNVEVTIGVSSGAVPNTLYSFGDPQTAQSVIGYGPGAEALALKLATGGSGNAQLYISPAPNYDGTISAATTHVGTGSGAVSFPNFAPLRQVSAVCTTLGALGTAQFTFQLGSGLVSVPVLSGASPWVFVVPGTQTQFTLTQTGANAAVGDTFTISALGTATLGGANTFVGNISQTSQPIDTYPVSIIPSITGGFNSTPVAASSLGTVSSSMYFAYGLDLDPVQNIPYSTSPSTLMPVGGKYAIPNSGIVVQFVQPTLVVKITTGGALGTMAFDYNLNSAGFTGSPITSTAGSSFSQLIPGSGLTVTFGTRVYVLNVTYTWSNQGVFTLGGGGGNADNVVSLSSQAFVAGDTYSVQTLATGYSAAALNATLTALLALPNQFSFIHVVGTPASAASAATIATTVDAQLTAAISNFRFVRALVECPTLGTWILSASRPLADVADTDNVLLDPTLGFGNFVSTRVGVGAGDSIVSNLLSGRFLRRNAAWQACARVAQVAISEDLAFVGRGALSFTRYLFRDEAKTPALDAGRFTTLRTYQGGEQGYWITNGRLMANSTSDFQLIQYGRVIDTACILARSGLLPFLSGKVRINPANGYINEKDAQTIEAQVLAILNAGLVSPGDATAAYVTLSRTTNLLSSGAEPVTVRILPFGYLKQIVANLGFFNPALSA